MNAVTNKIRLLKLIKPNQNWLKSEKENLLLKISESGKSAKSAWRLPVFVLPVFRPVRLLARPVLVTAMVLALIFGAGFLTVKAAKTALPGDLLYPVKLATENVKVRVSSQEAKPVLQAELFYNRAQELNQIISGTGDSSEKKDMVVKAADRLRAQVVSAKNELDKIKTAEPQKVVEAAEKISQKTAQSEKALIEAREKLAEEFQGEESREVVQAIDAAVKKVQETSILAAELKEAKGGIEVQMEVKEQEPQVEVFEEASVSFEEINK